MATNVPELPNGNGAAGWIVAAVVAVLGALAAFWRSIRGDKREDSTTALTHANRIIANYEKYANRRDARIVELEVEVKKARDSLGDAMTGERLALMKVEWLCGILKDHKIEIPPWPFDVDPEDGGPC